MSAGQWLVCALSLGSVGLLFIVAAWRGWRETQAVIPLGDEHLPPMTPGWEYREGLRTL